MSTGSRFALVVMVACALGVLGTVAAHAQVGPTNPSGGTSLRQSTLEGSGSFSLVGFLSRDPSFQSGWQGWFGMFAASRYASSVAVRPSDWRSLSAVVCRPAVRR